MILTTHAIVGAAVASFFPEHPCIAVAAGFSSHFFIDAIPHWDYPLHSFSLRKDSRELRTGLKARGRDAVVVGFDALAGLCIALAIFSPVAAVPIIVLGSIGGMLPDPLQVVYSKFPYEPMRSLQRFHVWMHTKRRLEDHLTGIGTQIMFALLVIGLTLACHGGIAGLAT